MLNVLKLGELFLFYYLESVLVVLFQSHLLMAFDGFRSEARFFTPLCFY